MEFSESRRHRAGAGRAGYRWVFAVMLALCLGVTSQASATRDRLDDAIDKALVDLAVLTETAAVADGAVFEALGHLYSTEDRDLIWPDRARSKAVFDAAMAAVEAHGLVAADYPIAGLETLFDQGRMTVNDTARRDVLLTLTVARFAQQVRYGRLDPRSISEILDYPVRTGDLARSVRFVAAAPGKAAERLDALAPTHPGYHDLKDLLARSRVEADRGGWPVPEAGPTLRPGQEDPRVLALHQRFGTIGGLLYGPENNQTFDARLVAAVEEFQTRNGLDVDGVIGPMTYRALAISADDRVRQIEMNMERWRWLPATLGHHHIFVNVPDYHIDIVEDGRLIKRMPSIVGRADRQTPIFSSRLTWLEFNPTWTVPERIAELDILPALIEDRDYLIDRRIRMYSSWRKDASQLMTRFIDWESMGKDIHRYRLRQDPGPQNPLGRVKFMMANNFSIYLHDTNQRNLFGKHTRSLSAGCVRVEDPRWLASHLMQMPELLDPEFENDYFSESWETKRVSLKRSMPIHLAYFTIWSDDGDRTEIRPDIYDFDARMADAWDQAPQPAISLAALP
ncbi:MAG: L,D-transpeptidase family protein [Pseudomonadota bacterium]